MAPELEKGVTTTGTKQSKAAAASGERTLQALLRGLGNDRGVVGITSWIPKVLGDIPSLAKKTARRKKKLFIGKKL